MSVGFLSPLLPRLHVHTITKQDGTDGLNTVPFKEREKKTSTKFELKTRRFCDELSAFFITFCFF